MTKITGQFKVGDRVRWITTRKGTVSYPVKTMHEGIIEEINPTTALIRREGKRRNVRVSLFKLEVIE